MRLLLWRQWGSCHRRRPLCCRRQDWILWMQSGHAQDKAARAYVARRSPVLLFRTWEAFDL